MDKDSNGYLKISEVVQQTGINPSTLRLWERYDLISPVRMKNNYRMYSNSDLQRIKDIVRLRSKEGLSLTTIRAALVKTSETAAMVSAKYRDRQDDQPLQIQPPTKLSVGWKLKGLRRDMGISLREAAARTGLTPSHISVLERTSSGASYETLSKLAQCYGTTMHDLNRIEPRSQDIQVIRSHGRALPLYRQGLKIEQMAEGFLKMDVTKLYIESGVSSGEEPYSHDGEEYIYVLRGQFEITFDGSIAHLLERDDSIYFTSTRPHLWRNPGKTRAELLWINTVPSF